MRWVRFVRAAAASLLLAFALRPVGADPDSEATWLTKTLQAEEGARAGRLAEASSLFAEVAEAAKGHAPLVEERALRGLVRVGLASSTDAGLPARVDRLTELRGAAGDASGALRIRVETADVLLGQNRHVDAMLVLGERDAAAAGGLAAHAAQLRAIAELGLGNLADAVWDAGRAVELASVARDAVRVARACAVLGEARMTLGDHEAARSDFARGLAALAGSQRIDRAILLGDLAKLDIVEGRVDEGLQAMQSVQKEFSDAGDELRVVIAWMNIAEAQRARGDHQGAQEALQKALAGVDPAGELGRVAALQFARSSVELGKSAEALRAVAPILERARRDRSLEMLSYAAFVAARAAEENGDSRSALAAALEGLRALRDSHLGLADSLVPEARERSQELFEIATRAAANTNDAVALTEVVDIGHGLAVAVGPSGDQETAPSLRIEERRTARELARAEQASDLRSRQGFRATKEEVESLQALKKRQLEILQRIEETRRRAATWRESGSADLSAREQFLGPNDVLVVLAAVPARDAPGTPLTAAVVAEPAAPIHIERLSPDFGTLASQALSVPDAAEAEGALRRAGTTFLSSLHVPATTRRLIVVPDGATALVPIVAALALAAPDVDVSLVPSAAVFALLRKLPDGSGEHVLALGDPEYDAGDSARAPLTALTRGRRPRRLLASLDEVKAIERSGDEVLVGRAATEASLRRALLATPRWRSVHLACHGLIDERHPALSSLALTADAEDDGYLTGAEIGVLYVPSDLVVLSACESARGKVGTVSGLQGLVRPFLVAGASRVMATLAKIDDAAAMRFTTEFYRRWREGGMPAAAAMRGAMETVRSEASLRHPRYWSVWTLWGLP